MDATARHSFINGKVLYGDENAQFDYIVPAFIDIHCHGGGGKYFSEDESVARTAHHTNGTGTMFASLVSEKIPVLLKQIETLKNADIYGIHLEGPYLSKKYCGAHDPELLRNPDIEEIDSLLIAGNGKVKMMTLAPELPNAIDAIKFLVNEGVIVAIGHSNANLEETKLAIDAGATVVTHFNNGMAKVPSSNSLSEASLDSELFLELIEDGLHVSNEISQDVIRHAPNRVIGITDAMSAATCADGEYRIGELEVTVSSGIARLKGTDTLAGSTLTMLDAFNNFVALVGFESAVKCTSINAARLIKIDPYNKYIGIKNNLVTYL